MKNLFKWFVYISLAFLLAFLYKADYIVIPEVFSPIALVLSFLFLFAGFSYTAVSWKKILGKSGYSAGMKLCFASTGLTEFGKYIPGKIWSVLGRAYYISNKKAIPLSPLLLLSLKDQFVSLWAGLMMGVVGLYLMEGLHVWGWLVLPLWILLTLAIFNRRFNTCCEFLLKKILKKDIEIPNLAMVNILKILPWYVLSWLMWSVGFYLLVMSLLPHNVTWKIAMAFPLAGTLGMFAIIAPGGLGAREGVLVGCLVMAGISTKEAIAISIASRLWFLMGEVYIFLTGMVVDKCVENTK